MDGRTDEWLVGKVKGLMDKLTGGWMDGQRMIRSHKSKPDGMPLFLRFYFEDIPGFLYIE